MKTCNFCKQSKPFESFSRHRSGLQSKCRECVGWYNLERNYKMSQLSYEKMLLAQGGACFLCKKVQFSRSLALDHDHACCSKTPTCGDCNRKLLCLYCNQLVANIENNNVDTLKRALQYTGISL